MPGAAEMAELLRKRRAAQLQAILQQQPSQAAPLAPLDTSLPKAGGGGVGRMALGLGAGKFLGEQGLLGGGAKGLTGAAGMFPQAAGMNLATPFATAAGPATAAGVAGLAGAGAPGAAALSSAAPVASGAAAEGISALISAISALFSSRRLKRNIETLRQIGDLRWVTYQYIPEIDPDGLPRVGLIAEEVAETHPEWVVMDEDGQPMGIIYSNIPETLWP